MKLSPSGLMVRWMSFAEDGDRILALRREVFSEQGFGPDVVMAPYDEVGLHLGAFVGDELVAAISAFVFDDEQEILAERYRLDARGRMIQFARRVGRKEYRGQGVAEFLAAGIICATYEVLRPQGLFLALQGEHVALRDHYAQAFGFEPQGMVPTSSGDMLVMSINGAAALRGAHARQRRQCALLTERLGVKLPSLLRHLDVTGRMDVVPVATFTGENLYIAPLSLKDELPRLSTQTRILFGEQKSRIQAVQFPSPPARLIDIGAGPGVYLSMLMRGSKLKGYEAVGLDASKEMVTYARLNRPDITWVHASAYDTKQPDQSFDVVHANFLFIHLICPSLALREIHRILKPGGILYVVDVNDATFQGPPEIRALVEAHYDLYEGDRKVLNVLPDLAAEYGLAPLHMFSSEINNTSTTPDPSFLLDEVRLDRLKMWGVLSFLAQREELAQYLKPALEVYYKTNCEISICVQTQVYRKTE